MKNLNYARLRFLSLMNLFNPVEIFTELKWNSRIVFLIISPLLLMAWLMLLMVASTGFVYDLIKG